MFEAILDTPLGMVKAVSDTECLYGLRFCDDRVEIKLPSCSLLEQFKNELDGYFKGRLTHFSIPYYIQSGSIFQQAVRTVLCQIPFGQTYSYSEVAQRIKKPNSVRAVGTALSKNPIQLILPCHRVIQANGRIGGYQAGGMRKNWLIQHEKNYMSQSLNEIG